jgi:hypothetical protein
VKTPKTVTEFYGCAVSYLKGTADHLREDREREIKRKNRLPDFRKKDAREVRDRGLAERGVCFLHQAFRLRGKANYRDAIYMSYKHGFNSYQRPQ